MIEFLCGALVGGNVCFLVAAMLLAGRPRTILKAGALLTYLNSRGINYPVVLVNDLRQKDEYAVVRKPDTQLEFVVAVDKISY